MNRIVLLGIAWLTGCSSPDSPVIKLTPVEAETLVAFSSAPSDSARVSLRLNADSTFLLDIETSSAPPQRIGGALRMAPGQYQLFFPDSTDRLNELITPVHQDASVVVYPDGSVALDRALDQFYVRRILVTKDSLPNSR